MTEISKIIQAVQLEFQLASTKQFKPSTWRISIEQKIDGWKTLINILERVNKFEKLTKEEKSKVQTLMSQEKLKLGNGSDITEAIVRLNEKIVIFSKKIEMHEKRKAFSKTNNNFELYRKRFYRSLSRYQTSCHNVPVQEIREFRSTMWNQ